jgi:hypothetical protein
MEGFSAVVRWAGMARRRKEQVVHRAAHFNRARVGINEFRNIVHAPREDLIWKSATGEPPQM